MLDPGRQALLTLVYLRKGDTYAALAPGFGVSVATVYRRVNETIDLLASRAEPLPEVLGQGHRPQGERQLSSPAILQGLFEQRDPWVIAAKRHDLVEEPVKLIIAEHVANL